MPTYAYYTSEVGRKGAPVLIYVCLRMPITPVRLVGRVHRFQPMCMYAYSYNFNEVSATVNLSRIQEIAEYLQQSLESALPSIYGR